MFDKRSVLSRYPIVLVGVLLLTAGVIFAQSGGAPACDLKKEQASLAEMLADFPAQVDADQEVALAALYQVGLAYQELATRCGHLLSQDERDALADYVLTQLDIPTLLARNTVGTDMDAILAKLEDLHGDPINGQLLYTGQEAATDGSTLGCSGCHESTDSVAPPTEGTWTRVTEVRLNDPALAGYDFKRYIVESIVEPNAYIAPDYPPRLMPDNFGQRLSIENLADLVAFLESQDQE